MSSVEVIATQLKAMDENICKRLDTINGRLNDHGGRLKEAEKDAIRMETRLDYVEKRPDACKAVRKWAWLTMGLVAIVGGLATLITKLSGSG